MPVTIKTAQFKYKNGEGEYVGVNAIGDEDAIAEIDSWLDRHPEATTTVVDGSVTYNKLNAEVSGDISDLKDALTLIDTATDNDIGKALSPKTVTNGHVSEWQFKSISGGGGGGTSDYSDLDNKPQINSVTLNGNKSLEELGIASVNALAGKAPAIFDESDGKYSFSNTELSEYTDGYTLICDATGLDSIYRIDAENIIPNFDAISAFSGVVTSNGGLTFHINGTRLSANNFFPKVNNNTNFTPSKQLHVGDKLRVSCIVSGTITTTNENPIRISIYFRYPDSTPVEKTLNIPVTDIGKVCSKVFDIEKENPQLQITPLVRSGEYDCDLTITAEIVTNEEWQTISVPSSGVVEILNTGVGNNGITLLPIKTVAKYIVDTKTYIDEHVPTDMLVESDLIYLSPEMYGAVGDGNTNDTTAVQNCINDAITKGVAVRGYGHYKTISPISIKGESLNIYIHNVTYTGSDVAFVLIGMYNYLCIDRLHAYGSTGAALRLCTDSAKDTSYNEVHLHNVYGYTNGIEMINLYGLSEFGQRQMYYNRIYTNQLYARTGHCFYFNTNGAQFGENSFFGKHVSNANGYFLYCDGASNSSTNRFYEYCIESASKNGVYGICTLINCRTTECLDKHTPSGDSGFIFTFNGVLPAGKCINTSIDYASVDVSNASTYNNRVNIIKETYESGSTKALSFSAGFSNGIKNYVVGNAVWLWTYYAITNPSRGNYSPRGKIIAYFNHKGFVPETDWYHEISISEYYTLETDSITPTIFDIKANTTIHLDDSYCPVGINKFKVKQTATEKATIYDHNNVLVFNGQTLDAGTYIVSCYMTDKTITVQTANETLVYEGNITRGFYFGDNEAWTVEKLNIVS